MQAVPTFCSPDCRCPRLLYFDEFYNTDEGQEGSRIQKNDLSRYFLAKYLIIGHFTYIFHTAKSNKNAICTSHIRYSRSIFFCMELPIDIWKYLWEAKRFSSRKKGAKTFLPQRFENQNFSL